MTTARCGVIELAEQSETEVQTWVAHMEAHRADVNAVFADAGIELESFFLTRLQGKDYLISYIRIVDVERAHRAHLEAARSTNPTTQANERFRNAVWRSVFEARLLFDHKTTPTSA